MNTSKPTVSFVSPNLLKQQFQLEAPNQAMKKEELNRRIFQILEELELAYFEYIEGFYNSKRTHSFNDMLTPDEKENHFSHTSSLF
ncbi:IS3 family transposase [Listeria monocytogenes]